MKKGRIFYGTVIIILFLIILSVISVSAFAQTPFPPEPPDDERGESEQIPAGEPSITTEEAQSAAQAHIGTTAAPHEVELEYSQGQLVYSVEFAGVEVEVDATTGEIAGTWSDDD